MQDLNELIARATAQIAECNDLSALDQVRVSFLGKKGELTEQLKQLGQLTADERPAAGQIINEAKAAVQALLSVRKETLDSAALEAELAAGAIDVSLSGIGQLAGGMHPVTRTRLRIEAIFASAGFQIHQPDRDLPVGASARHAVLPLQLVARAWPHPLYVVLQFPPC